MIVFTIIIVFLILFFYPFRFTLIIDEGRISLYLLAKRLYHQHWKETTEQVTETTIKYLKLDIIHLKDIRYIQLLNAVDYHYVSLLIGLPKDDFATTSMVAGWLQGVLFLLDTTLTNSKIPLTYQLAYANEYRIRLQARFEVRFFFLLKKYIQLRRFSYE